MSNKEGVNTTNCSAAAAAFSMRLVSVVHHDFFFVPCFPFRVVTLLNGGANIPHAFDAGGINGPVPERLSRAGPKANLSIVSYTLSLLPFWALLLFLVADEIMLLTALVTAISLLFWLAVVGGLPSEAAKFLLLSPKAVEHA